MSCQGKLRSALGKANKINVAWLAGCSKSHLPGYVKDHDKLKAAGAEVIVCTSTDNGFTQAAWAEVHKAGGKVRRLIALLATALWLENT